MNASLIQFGLQLAGSLASQRLGAATSAAQGRINKANADASNLVRAASNELAVAQSSLGRHVQAINNNRALRYGGDVLAALGSQAAVLTDQTTKAGLERRLAAAGELGGIAATAAAAGVGGNAVDALRETVARRHVRAAQEAAGTENRQQYALLDRRASVARDTIEGLNSDVILDRMDYAVTLPGMDPSAGQPGVFSQLLKAFATSDHKLLANGLTLAGGRTAAVAPGPVRAGPLGSGTFGINDDYLSIK